MMARRNLTRRWRARISAWSFLLVHGEDLGGDDGTGAATDPTCGGGARDTEVTEQHGVAFFADEVAHAVVIRMTAG